jgi:hypothetical protein
MGGRGLIRYQMMWSYRSLESTPDDGLMGMGTVLEIEKYFFKNRARIAHRTYHNRHKIDRPVCIAGNRLQAAFLTEPESVWKTS